MGVPHALDVLTSTTFGTVGVPHALNVLTSTTFGTVGVPHPADLRAADENFLYSGRRSSTSMKSLL